MPDARAAARRFGCKESGPTDLAVGLGDGTAGSLGVLARWALVVFSALVV